MDIFSKEKRSEIMSRIRSKDTAPEKAVRSLLHSLGYRFRLHQRNLPGIPDLVFRKYKLAVFVHGCFWHGHKCKAGTKQVKTNTEYWTNKIRSNIERDSNNIALLSQLGWKVVVVWECCVQKGAIDVRRMFMNCTQ
ncbi:MAG: DNA mismatch endonuclease Vsr [Desulfovibrio sp.]|nr:DNA mismatch endonuclease Vsr [Desulfovibrio sp.]